jgi:hypothetical protein
MTGPRPRSRGATEILIDEARALADHPASCGASDPFVQMGAMTALLRQLADELELRIDLAPGVSLSLTVPAGHEDVARRAAADNGIPL